MLVEREISTWVISTSSSSSITRRSAPAFLSLTVRSVRVVATAAALATSGGTESPSLKLSVDHRERCGPRDREEKEAADEEVRSASQNKKVSREASNRLLTFRSVSPHSHPHRCPSRRLGHHKHPQRLPPLQACCGLSIAKGTGKY